MCLVICWSSGFIGAVLASHTESIFLVLMWRFVLASALLFPFLLTYLKKCYLPAIALQAMIGFFAMYGYLATGVKAIDVGVPTGTAALIASLQPLATATLAGLALHEPVSETQWLGLLIGLIGVAIAIGGGYSAAPIWGFALSFVSMLSIVAATLLTKRVGNNLPLLPTLAVHCLISAAMFFVTTFLQGSIIPELNRDFWFAVLWFVGFSTLGAYGFYWLCLRNSTAVRVASLIYFTPSVTMIWAWLMFGERVQVTAILGFLICIVGVVLASATRNLFIATKE